MEFANTKSDDPKQFWDLINKFNQQKQECPVSLVDFLNHFEKLNHENPNSSDSFDPREIKHSINSFINEDITLDEVSSARNHLKSKKACGVDNILNEFIRHCPMSVLEIICKFFNVVLNTGLVPNAWNIGIIIPLYKNKGSVRDPNNYRGITLLSSLGKLFTSIINTRLTNYINGIGLLGEDQAGFRAGYSTLDHIFTLKCIIDIYLQKKKKEFIVHLWIIKKLSILLIDPLFGLN